MNATTLTDRAVIRLSGEDVRGFLQGLVTKALFDFLVWPDGDDLLLDVEASQAEALARRLTLYRLRRPIRIAIDKGLAVHWSRDGTEGVADPRLPALGQRWIAPHSQPVDGWQAHRLSLGVTEGVGELGNGETLWLECNARELNGVSFTKGCYIGQENTARMHHRAKVNRRLVVAPLAEPGDRTRATYPDLGLMIEHRRVEALGDALIPDWLAPALA
jgi:tRNA-modifying protein YgfZ